MRGAQRGAHTEGPRPHPHPNPNNDPDPDPDPSPNPIPNPNEVLTLRDQRRRGTMNQTLEPSSEARDSAKRTLQASAAGVQE